MLLCLYHIEIFLFVLFFDYVIQVNNLTLALSVKFCEVSLKSFCFVGFVLFLFF